MSRSGLEGWLATLTTLGEPVSWQLLGPGLGLVQGKLTEPQKESSASCAECSLSDQGLVTGVWLWKALALPGSLEVAREEFDRASEEG